MNTGSGDLNIDFAIAQKPFTAEVPVLGHSWFFNLDMFFDYELYYFECSECGLIINQFNTGNRYIHIINLISKCSYLDDSLSHNIPSCETVKMHEALV